jgi:hypothetical protein
MSTYRIFFNQGASTSVEVEADDFEAAIEAAYDHLPVGLCHQCAHLIDLSGDWEEDASGYYVDGELIEPDKSR